MASKKLQKAFSQEGDSKIFIIIVLFGLLLVVGVIYYKLNQSKTPSSTTPSTQTSTINTTGWKTYTNNDFHFSLKYPPQFTLKVDNYPASADDPKTVINLWFHNTENGKDVYSGYNFDAHTASGKTLSQEFPKGFYIYEMDNVKIQPVSETHGADEAGVVPLKEWSDAKFYRVNDTFFEVTPIIQDRTATDVIWNYPIIDTLSFSK